MLKFVQCTSPLASASSSSSPDSAEVSRQRLLADDVLAGGERLLHLRVVQVVRRRQVDDVDRVVREQRLVAVVDRREPPSRAARSGRRADDAGDGHAEPPQRVDVDDADEAGADDAGPEIR